MKLTKTRKKSLLSLVTGAVSGVVAFAGLVFWNKHKKKL